MEFKITDLEIRNTAHAVRLQTELDIIQSFSQAERAVDNSDSYESDFDLIDLGEIIL